MYGDGDVLYGGITFISNLNIGNQEFSSFGKCDILILSMDPVTSESKYQHCGSPSDENVQELFYDNGNLFFGGELSGSTFERIVGLTKFYNYTPGLTSCYATIVNPLDLQSLQSENLKISKKKNETPKNSSRVSPNPFSEDFILEYHNENVAQQAIYTIYNSQGFLLEEQSFSVSHGTNEILITSLRSKPDSIYTMYIQTEKGDVEVLRMIKIQ